jgi:hypothetical protein
MTRSYDLSDLGGSQVHDLSDLGGTLVTNQSSNMMPTQAQDMRNQAYSQLKDTGSRDVLAGLLDFGTGIANAPHNIANAISPSLGAKIPSISQRDYGQMLGVDNPSLIDKAIQGAAHYAPYAIGAEALGLGGIGGQTAAGAAYGATQSQNPVSGTIEGAFGGLGGGLLGKGVGALASKVSSIPSAISNYFTNKNIVEAAPEVMNKLVGSSDPSNIPLAIKSFVQGAYKDNKETASEMAKPLNNSTVRFDSPGDTAKFPKYASSAYDLLAQRENLNNLFGSESDLGSRVNKELDFAQNFLKNKDTFGVDFKDIWGRIQNLGDLAADAGKSGDRNASRLLGNLRSSLADDLNTNLENSGNGDVAKQLADFNNYYKSKVVPFWDDRTIAKSAQDPNHVPSADVLAKALYKPSLTNASVLQELSPYQKNVVLAQLLSKGRSQNITPDQVGRNWNNLTDDVRSKVTVHSPDIANYLNNLGNIFNQQPSYGVGGVAKAAMNALPGGSHLSILANLLSSVPNRGTLNRIPSNYLSKPISPFLQQQLIGYTGNKQ